MTKSIHKRQCFDDSGRPVPLARELGRGGEGAVFDVQNSPANVAKIYHNAIAPDKSEKLQVMCQMGTPSLKQVAAWPICTLRHAPAGDVIGFLQPRVQGTEIHELYGCRSREQHFAQADWRFLVHTAMNVAGAVETIHSHGHVIGDVNSKNVWVSKNGTVAWVDCDSFHISNGGRKFLCEVGVDLYTPPELQGRSFNGIERTSNHDCFGLAILIFQLLFAARHPYMGVYRGGASDLTIEQAIREHRFAFGRNARSLQMEPPPFSPRLDLVPTDIAGLFEAAFDSASCRSGGRPSATRWHAALSQLRQQLKACSNDKGHVYYQGLSRCPWCEIARLGGPNYFRAATMPASSQVVLTLFRVDFAGIEEASRRLESFAAPARDYLRHMPQAYVPRELDDEITTNASTRQLVTRVATWVSGLIPLGLLLVFQSRMLGAMVALLGVMQVCIFGGWSLILKFVDPLRRERAVRKRIVSQRRSEFEQALRERERIYAQFPSQIDAGKNHLDESHSGLRALQGAYDLDYRRLEADNRRAQLDAFLDSHLISSAKISGIGNAKLAALAAFGIETALDIVEQNVLRVPGFGPVKTSDLVAWRGAIERQFRFNPAQKVSPKDLLTLNSRYFLRQKELRDQILHGTEVVASIYQKWNTALAEFDHRLEHLSELWYAAEADLQVAAVKL